MNEKMTGFFAAILLIGCFSFGPFVEATQCPSANWTSFGDHCYTVVNNVSSWQESENYCQSFGGHLYSAFNETEEEVIVFLVPSGEQFWIGLFKTDEEDVYSWSDGSDLVFHNFDTSEPKSTNETSCVYLLKNGTASDWYTKACSVPLKSICETVTVAVTNAPPSTRSPASSSTVPTTPTPVKRCPEGWFQVDDMCYMTGGFSESARKNWTDAILVCKNMGAELATLHSHAEQSALTAELIFAGNSPVWIGLYAAQGETFKWDDGSPLDFEKWARNEPNGELGDMRCVELLNNEDETGRWSDDNCGLLGGYACQKPANESYPTQGPIISICGMPGFTSFRESCFHVITTPMNFSQAQVTCEDRLANLASVVDGYEEGFVETLLFQNNLESAWIGLNDVKDEGMFVWTDTWPVWYTNWGHDEPSRGEGEGCVALNSDGTWNDTVCSEERPAICKFTFDTKPTDPPSVEGYCPQGWNESGNYCYMVRSSGPKVYVWEDANAQCQSMESELVSIHSKYENEFVESLVKVQPAMEDFYWIGLYRNDEDGFSWTDFSPVEYDYWENRQPATDDEKFKCGMFSSEFGQWSVEDCMKTEGFICKSPKIPATSPRSTLLSSSEATSFVTTVAIGTSYSMKPSSESPVSTNKATTMKSTTTTMISIPDEEADGLSTGAIVGICLASFAFVCMIVVVIILAATGRVTVPKFSSSPTNASITNAVFVYDTGGDSMRVDDKASILVN
ncbi:Macrophage mannose receptor 1 [Holothuria leucospilota]|uniref:Macrophage mannose receptor 1 n=1 Tax=Holothuria leucospilota TaxID=206669 RepID=A0A9Q1H8R8_HOLLE|nr:Macrophage mannose receptor 1 [Holothuria leucospilota]